MSYRVIYGAELPTSASRHDQWDERAETFSTEFEALTRARELLDNAQAPSVAVRDSAGNVLGGVRLQLKLQCCSD